MFAARKCVVGWGSERPPAWVKNLAVGLSDVDSDIPDICPWLVAIPTDEGDGG